MPRSSSRGRSGRGPRVRAAAVGAAMVALALTSGCGLRHLARTVGKGRGEVRASLGGPIIGSIDPGFPLPGIRVGGRYGATDWLDVSGDVSVEPLLLGVLGVDAGAVAQIYRDQSFAFSASAHFHLLFDLDDDATTRGFPELGLHLEHRLESWLTLFGGAVAVAQFEPPEGKPPVFAAPYLGFELVPDAAPPIQQAVVFQLAWISPWEDFSGFVGWEPAGHGAIVVLLGWRTVVGPGEVPPVGGETER